MAVSRIGDRESQKRKKEKLQRTLRSNGLN